MVTAAGEFFDSSVALGTVCAIAALFGSPGQVVLIVDLLARALARVPLLAA